MIHIRSTALPAAVTLFLFVGACQDAPSGPRRPAEPASVSASQARSSGVHVYSGRSADSVANQILTAWSLHGHPEYLAERKASRINLRLATVAAARLAPNSTGPQMSVDGDGSAATYKSPATIMDHHEQFYFGSSGSGGGIQTLLNASMSFIGDRGRIFANVTVTGNGATIPASGTLADGGGDPLGCSDVVYGNCGSSKLLEGSLVINNAPYCDARATGSATFTAQNTDVTVGSPTPFTSTSGGYSGLPATAVGTINSASRACSVDDGNWGAGAGSGTGTGSGATGGGADAPPTWPAPQPAAPYNPPPPPLSFHCETVTWYYAGTVEAEYGYCYAD